MSIDTKGTKGNKTTKPSILEDAREESWGADDLSPTHPSTPPNRHRTFSNDSMVLLTRKRSASAETRRSFAQQKMRDCRQNQNKDGLFEEVMDAVRSQCQALQHLNEARTPQEEQNALRTFYRAETTMSKAKNSYTSIVDNTEEGSPINHSERNSSDKKANPIGQDQQKPTREGISSKGPHPIFTPQNTKCSTISNQDFEIVDGKDLLKGMPDTPNTDSSCEMVIILEKVEKIPKSLSGYYKMEPSVRMFVSDIDGKIRSNVVTWPARNKTLNPVWNTPRCLQVESIGEDALESSYIHVHLLLPTGGKVGSAQVSISVLNVGHSIGSALAPLLDPDVCTVSFRRVAPPVESIKHIFLFRHAQSVWNWAKANKSITTLVSQVDHPLTKKGLKQSRNFRKKLSNILSYYSNSQDKKRYHHSRFCTSSGSLTPPVSKRRIKGAGIPLSSTLPEAIMERSRERNDTKLSLPKHTLRESTPPVLRQRRSPNRNSPKTMQLIGDIFKKEFADVKTGPDKGPLGSSPTSTENQKATCASFQGDTKYVHDKIPSEYWLKHLVAADAAWSSPLTRAVETCLLALADHPMWERDTKLRVNLCSCIREKRGWGTLDTQGRDAGPEMVGRIRRLMKRNVNPRGYGVKLEANRGSMPSIVSSRLGGGRSRSLTSPTVLRKRTVSTPLKAKAVSSTVRRWEGWLVDKLDVGDCTDKWWNTSKESVEDLHVRIREFVNMVRYMPQRSIIVVGHSGFFRNFVQYYASSDLLERKPDLVLSKLENCEMRGLRFNIKTNSIEDIAPITKSDDNPGR